MLWIPVAVWLVGRAPAGSARTAVTIYAVSIGIMFSASAVVHFRIWSPRVTEALFRLDHTGIYLAIAGSATAVSVLGLDGWTRIAALVFEWTIAIIGIVVEWLAFAPPRGFSNTVFLTMSWPSVLVLPNLLSNTGWDTVGLLAAGGLLYTVGAAIVGLRRPDPWPEVFGYHEIWHGLVVVAVALHAIMIGVTLLPPPTG